MSSHFQTGSHNRWTTLPAKKWLWNRSLSYFWKMELSEHPGGRLNITINNGDNVSSQIISEWRLNYIFNIRKMAFGPWAKYVVLGTECTGPKTLFNHHCVVWCNTAVWQLSEIGWGHTNFPHIPTLSYIVFPLFRSIKSCLTHSPPVWFQHIEVTIFTLAMPDQLKCVCKVKFRLWLISAKHTQLRLFGTWTSFDLDVSKQYTEENHASGSELLSRSDISVC